MGFFPDTCDTDIAKAATHRTVTTTVQVSAALPESTTRTGGDVAGAQMQEMAGAALRGRPGDRVASALFCKQSARARQVCPPALAIPCDRGVAGWSIDRQELISPTYRSLNFRPQNEAESPKTDPQ